MSLRAAFCGRFGLKPTVFTHILQVEIDSVEGISDLDSHWDLAAEVPLV